MMHYAPDERRPRDVSDVEEDMTGPGDVCGRFSPQPVFRSPEEALKAMDALVPPRLTAKDGNPKDAVGTGKVPFSTVPARPIAEVGLAMLEGARKYGRHNYRVAGVRSSVYYDAALRHLTAWWEGQDIDPDSGLPHIIKAMACLVVLRDAQHNAKLTDDRPPPVLDRNEWVSDLNEKAAEIIARYPNPAPAYTR